MPVSAPPPSNTHPPTHPSPPTPAHSFDGRDHSPAPSDHPPASGKSGPRNQPSWRCPHAAIERNHLAVTRACFPRLVSLHCAPFSQRCAVTTGQSRGCASRPVPSTGSTSLSPPRPPGSHLFLLLDSSVSSSRTGSCPVSGGRTRCFLFHPSLARLSLLCVRLELYLPRWTVSPGGVPGAPHAPRPGALLAGVLCERMNVRFTRISTVCPPP